MEERIRRALSNLVKVHKDFVIYPYGKWGRVAKRILNEEFGIKENYIVDNGKTSSKGIFDTVYLEKDYKKRDFMILLAVDPNGWNNSLEIHRQISWASVDRIADILARSTYFNPWNHYDSIYTLKWPKVALIESIAREVYRNNIVGSVAEAGVFQGQTARFINQLFPDRKLYLFDTFEGFDENDQKSDDKRNMFNLKIDFTNTTEEYVLNRMNFPQNVIMKKGWFPDSAMDVEDKFVFVRLDMDLYNPIYAGLEFFYPRMQPGGYIIVHDCRSKNFDGARAALIDFCKKYNLGYMCMPDNLGSAIINIGL